MIVCQNLKPSLRGVLVGYAMTYVRGSSFGALI